MTAFIGDEGGIAIGEESTYGTAAVARVWQHPKSANLVPIKPLIKPQILGTAPRTKTYGVGHSASEVAVAMDDSRAVVGGIFNHFGNLTTNDFLIGSGAAADKESLTLWTDLGGYLMQYTGFVGSMLRKSMLPDQDAFLTMNGLARVGTSETPVTITAPSEAGIIMESDLGSITVGGASLCILSATCEVNWAVESPTRHCLGTSTPKKFVRTGVPLITGSLDLELSSDTGEDTIHLLADFLSGSSIGDVVIGNTTLAGAWMTGDFPVLGPGIVQFTLNYEADSWTETTTA